MDNELRIILNLIFVGILFEYQRLLKQTKEFI